MKRSGVLAHPFSDPSSSQPELHFVHHDAPSVRVRRYVVEGHHGPVHVAELSALEAGTERAVIDAASGEELGTMIEAAARMFAISVRFRARSSRVHR